MSEKNKSGIEYWEEDRRRNESGLGCDMDLSHRIDSIYPEIQASW